MNKIKRLVRILLHALLVAVAVILAVAVCTLGVLQTPWGSRRVLAEILPRLNSAISGRVEIGRVSLAVGHLGAAGLVLRDPDGEKVATVANIEIWFSPWALLHHRIKILRARIEAPQLVLRNDGEGTTNLARALSRRSAQPERKPEGGPTGGAWSYQLDGLDITDGALTVERAARLPTVQVSVSRLHLDGGLAKLATLNLEMQGELRQPRVSPFRVSIHGKGTLVRPAARLELQSSLEVGGSRLQVGGSVELRGGFDSLQGASATVAVENVRAEPELVRAFLPGWPLRVAIGGAMRAVSDGSTGETRISVSLGAAQARLALEAQGNLRARSVDSLTLIVRDVDLAKLSDRAPSSNLSLECQANGRGDDLASIEGNVAVHVPRGELAGRPAGPLRLSAHADHGNLRLSELFLAIPGLRMKATGQASRNGSQPIDVRGVVDLQNLQTVARALSVGRWPARGSGHLAFAITNTFEKPSVRLAGRLDHFKWNQVELASARLALRLPDARRPLAADLALSVPRLDVGRRHFEGLRVRVQGAGRRFAGRLSVARPERVDLAVAGAWRPAPRALLVSRVRLSAPQATWRLLRPAQLLAGQGRVRLGELVLAAAPDQRIRLAFEQAAHGLHAHVAISNMDLAGVPLRLLSIGRAAGHLDADADVHQLADRRSVHLRLALHSVSFASVVGIDGTADVQLNAERAQADFDLRGGGARASGRVSLPLNWPPEASSALNANLVLSAADLRQLATTVWTARALGASAPLPRKLQIGGLARGSIELGGTVAHPSLSASINVTALRWQDDAIGDVGFDLRMDDGAPWSAHLTLSQGASGAGPGQVMLSWRSKALPGVPIDWARLPRAVATLPFELDAHANLDLAHLLELLRRPALTGGTASLSAHLSGTTEDTQGQAEMKLTSVSAQGVPPTDAQVQLAVAGRKVQARLHITRRQAALLAADATVHASLARLVSMDALPTIGIDAHANLGPLDWQHAGIVSESGRPHLLRGRVGAVAEVGGTIGQPHVQIQAKIPDIELDQRSAGAGDVHLAYDRGSVTGNLNLIFRDGGRFLLDGSADADLGYPAAMHLPPGDQVPIRASLRATDFDLSIFAGWSPFLRTVAGKLGANLSVSGTVADPRPSGYLELKEGRLVMTDFGDYRKIHLFAHGDRDRFIVELAGVDSGSGHAQLRAEATHEQRGGYTLRSSAKADKLPIYVQGQALAKVSLSASAESQFADGRLTSRMKLSSARLALNKVERKHLQPLSPPGDVILVDRGNPVDKQQARKLSAVDETLARGKPAAGTSPPQGSVAKPRVVLTVDAPRDVWVVAEDSNVELGFLPGFRVEIADTARVWGQVVVKRGYVTVVGRRFQLKGGSTIQFSGPTELPNLDVSAEYASDTENVTVVATIKGAPGHVQIGLTAPDRPDLTESQLYTLVLTGRLNLGGGPSTGFNPAGEAESLLGGLLASQLQTLFANKLPFDVLTLQAGATPGSAMVEAGKYFTSDFYVGYVGRIGADPTLLQNRNAVHFEYDLGSRWSFQGEYGDAKTGMLDLFWTKRY